MLSILAPRHPKRQTALLMDADPALSCEVNVCGAHEDEDRTDDWQQQKPETQRVQAQVVDMATRDLLHPSSISSPEAKEMQMLCGAVLL